MHKNYMALQLRSETADVRILNTSAVLSLIKLKIFVALNNNSNNKNKNKAVTQKQQQLHKQKQSNAIKSIKTNTKQSAS